jgi:tRNA pseudouridine55 synthase
VELAPVFVRVFRWDVRSLDETGASVTITCGSGTYIRALARDLGRLAGSAAHLASLRRTRVGAFDVASAHPLTTIAGQESPPPLRMLRVCADD